MYSNAIDQLFDEDRYLELAARIEWEEQGSLERPRTGDRSTAYALSAAEPLRG